MDMWDDDLPKQEYELDRHAEEADARMVPTIPCPVCGELMRVDDPTDYHGLYDNCRCGAAVTQPQSKR